MAWRLLLAGSLAPLAVILHVRICTAEGLVEPCPLDAELSGDAGELSLLQKKTVSKTSVRVSRVYAGMEDSPTPLADLFAPIFEKIPDQDPVISFNRLLNLSPGDPDYMWPRGVPSAPISKIQIIGAGGPRTTTESLDAALKYFGYNMAHGTFLNIPFMNLTARYNWEDWTRGGPFKPALDSLLDNGFVGALDMPFFFAYKELMELYPEAKVILSIHPKGPEGWIESVTTKLYPTPVTLKPRPDYESWAAEQWWRLYKCDVTKPWTQASKQQCMEHYEAHNAEVIRTVPANRLLVLNASKGWKPLCDFLGVPVPGNGTLAYPVVDGPGVDKDFDDLTRRVTEALDKLPA